MKFLRNIGKGLSELYRHALCAEIGMLRAIAERVGVDLGQNPHVEAFSEKTEPERLVQQIEARANDANC